jgi:tRNA1Val (adenine37-N6)-methyltransferase
MIGQHGIQNDANAKTIARHEVLCDLDDILRESAKILKQGGRFYMVHRPFRLAEIFSKMVAYHIEPKRIRLVYPLVDKVTEYWRRWSVESKECRRLMRIISKIF